MTADMAAPAPAAPRGAAPDGTERFPALDGFRAFAALAVLLNHVALLSGLLVRNPTLGPYLARADVGVSIFFLLSGFLLYRPFVAARFDGRPARDLGSYVMRRVLRIVPAYWFALVVIGFVMRNPGFEEPHSIVAHFLLLHVYDLQQAIGGPVQQSWTLATEVSFYVFLPFWAWFMRRRDRAPHAQLRVEVVGLALLWTGSMALKLGVVAAGVSAARMGQLGMWLPFRLDEFALGMGLAVASAWVSHRGLTLPGWVRRTPATLACWAVAAFLFWITCTQLDMPLAPLFSPRQAVVVRAMYAFCALFLLTPAVFGPRERGLVPALFQNRLMVWLGLVSYGIYIWHEAWQDRYLQITDQQPFLAPFWGMLAFTLACTLVSAAISWYLVERPALRFAHRPPRPAPAA